MPALSDPNELLASLTADLDAEDFDGARDLLDHHDRAVREFAAAQGSDPAQRERMIELQRLQLALIELLRSRRDGIAGELQGLGRGREASRAYREGESS